MRRFLLTATLLLASIASFAQPEVSPVPVRSLLGPGSTSKVYVHFMAWFDNKSHINVGYLSNDPAVVKKQVTELKRRGVDGAIVDWYGSNNSTIDGATLTLRREAESQGIAIVVCLDVGLLKNRPNKSQLPTDRVIEQLKYVATNYFSSGAYGKLSNGKYIVLEFGMDPSNLPTQFDKDHPVDWAKVKTAFPNIAILHRNTPGYTKVGDGAYSWLDSANSSAGYLVTFLSTSGSYPTKVTMPSAWAQFDDTRASWSKDRVVDGRDGQLWLETWQAINKYYLTHPWPEVIQLVTWNDYEEGTALEPGIDSRVSIQAAYAGSGGTVVMNLLAGKENTIDHVEVAVNGGQWQVCNTRSIDLTTLSSAPSIYTVQFRAIGRPFFQTKYSNIVKVESYPLLQWRQLQ